MTNFVFHFSAYLTSKGLGSTAPPNEQAENNYNHYEDNYDNAEGLRSRRKTFQKTTSSASTNSTASKG